MKNNADALIFHTAICAEAPQIALITETKQHLLILSRGSYAALRNGDYYHETFHFILFVLPVSLFQ